MGGGRKKHRGGGVKNTGGGVFEVLEYEKCLSKNEVLKYEKYFIIFSANTKVLIWMRKMSKDQNNVPKTLIEVCCSSWILNENPSLIPTAILQDLARILQESCKITHHLARSCKILARSCNIAVGNARILQGKRRSCEILAR